MKTKLLILALLAASTSFAQTETIGRIRSMGVTISELSRTIIKKDTAYVLTFKDVTYKRIAVDKTVVFRDLRAFKASVYSCLEAKDVRRINLGTTPAIVGHVRELGTDCVRFVAKDGYVVWTEKQIGKLFL